LNNLKIAIFDQGKVLEAVTSLGGKTLEVVTPLGADSVKTVEDRKAECQSKARNQMSEMD
jgi:hypothetical protein